MALQSGIYIIINNINQKCYIGQSKDIKARFKQHKSENYRKHHCDKALYKAFDKYNIKNFSFSVIDFCQIDKLDKCEIYWIKYYNSYRNGYNRTIGGKTIGLRDPSNYAKKKYKIVDIFDYINMEYLDEKIEGLLVHEVDEYLDGIETMFDFAEFSGYNNFESWAECNLI